MLILGRVAVVSDNSVVQKSQRIQFLSLSLSYAILCRCINSHDLEMAAIASGITFLYFNVRGHSMVKIYIYIFLWTLFKS